jgi:uncharacterized membrane protein (DUF441 family)
MIMRGEILLVMLIIVGIFGRSPIIATAASLLLVLKLTALDQFLPLVERRGLELGLLFLMLSVLVPFAAEKVSWKDILSVFTSWYGILALAGGAIATYMNGKGLDLLKMEPELIVGLVVGSIFGIVFMQGVPVGPLMAAGITVFLMQLFKLILGGS